MKKLLLFFCLVTVFFPGMKANNITVSNVTITDQNLTSHYCNIKFDITWDNSWRTDGIPYNYDAAWIIVKYKVSGGTWQHATLSSTQGDHTAASGSTIMPESDGKGVYMYRSSNGTGTVTWNNAKLRWYYLADGVADDAAIELKVIAIEMVYITQADFWIGDGDGTYENNYAFHHDDSNDPLQITTSLSDTIKVDLNANDDFQIINNGIRVEGDAGVDDDIDGAIENGNYPTGYRAFYCMKYEISQEQYMDFLNTLIRAQQVSRVQTNITAGGAINNRYVMSNTAAISHRNGIRCDAVIPAPPTPVTFYCDYNGNSVSNEADDGQNIACNYLTWMDGAAYADWVALRPMTELEFEKACRGINSSVYGELAWGNTNIYIGPAYGLSNAGYTNEVLLNPPANTGNCNRINFYPLRCGIFAASSPNHTRQEAGAGYYGNMEMSGNCNELIVNIGTVAGRSFKDNNGNGALDPSGNADVDYWPGINNNGDPATANTTYQGVDGVKDAAGSGLRGGSYSPGPIGASSRDEASLKANVRNDNKGIRLVRTAP